MVKAADLGYPSTNIGQAPTKKELRKKFNEDSLTKATLQLAGSATPDRLTPKKPERLT